MASITSQIELIDRMSSPLYTIVSAVESLTNGVRTADDAIQNGFDSNRLFDAQSAVDQTNIELQEMTQRLQRASNKQEQLNQKFRQGESAIDRMSDKLLGVVSAYAGIQTIGKAVDLSDEMTQTKARLNLVNDGLQTTAELQNKIFASAQESRTAYMATADVVAKLSQRAGSIWESNNETIAFAQNLNKAFVIAGASQQEISSASLQLTQALGAGALRGEELNAVFEAAPNIIQTIADYLDVDIGKIREMASEGQITASIVKNAMLSATDEINAQFNSMPLTWGQVWTNICNRVVYATQPMLNLISWAAQNWSVLEPVVIGVAGALGAYVAVLAVYNAQQAITNGLTAMAAARETYKVAAMTEGTAAAVAATAAQHGLNAALLACPLTWIIVAIIAVVAAIYAIVAAVNKATGSTYSATGIIMGCFAVAGAFILNLLIGLVNAGIGLAVELYNVIAAFVNFFGNVWTNPVGAIMTLFSDLFDFILGVVQAAAKAIDTLLGTDMSGAIAGFRDMIDTKVQDIAGEQRVFLSKQSAADNQIQRIEYGDAYSWGNKAGTALENKFGKMFGGGTDFDFATDNLAADVAGINENTGVSADAVTATNEELKYLRDLAEQETINRFTTAEIKVDMVANNNVSSNVDLDGMMDYMVGGLQSAMEQAAEGVHE